MKRCPAAHLYLVRVAQMNRNVGETAKVCVVGHMICNQVEDAVLVGAVHPIIHRGSGKPHPRTFVKAAISRGSVPATRHLVVCEHAGGLATGPGNDPSFVRVESMPRWESWRWTS